MGTITITTFYEDDDIWVVFKDTGPGIDSSDLEKIFQPFYTSKEKGTGLGLAIVKSLVEAYDGEVIIKSKIKHGTKISLRFPVQLNV